MSPEARRRGWTGAGSWGSGGGSRGPVPGARRRARRARMEPSRPEQRTRAAWSPRPPATTPAPGPRQPLAGGGFGEIEGEGFELDREVDVLEADVFGHFEARRGEVQDRADPGAHQQVGHGLRRFSRHRHDRDLDAARLDLVAQIAAREDRDRKSVVEGS